MEGRETKRADGEAYDCSEGLSPAKSGRASWLAGDPEAYEDGIS